MQDTWVKRVHNLGKSYLYLQIKMHAAEQYVDSQAPETGHFILNQMMLEAASPFGRGYSFFKSSRVYCLSVPFIGK